ncbi:MAG: proliferating cell nuclear antigen (pcna) [Thermoplasmata archaeon]
MFHAKIKAETLKEVIDVISKLVDEAKFKITKEGLNIKAVDPAHVAMVDLTLDIKAFEEYKATEMELGIDIDKFKDVLKLADSPSDILTLEYNKEKNKIVVDIGNIKRIMSLVDTSNMVDTKVPTLNLPVKVVVRASAISKGIMASEKISDHIALVVSPDRLELIAKGNAEESAILALTKDMKDDVEELECKQNTKSLFSIDYFMKMIKSVGSGKVTMNIGADYPVKLEFNIADGNGRVMYLLAPRIESET